MIRRTPVGSPTLSTFLPDSVNCSFLDLILPSGDSRLREIVSRKAPLPEDSTKNLYEVNFGLLRLLEKELELQCDLQRQRSVLEAFPGYSVYSIFQRVAAGSAYYVAPDGLLDFLQSNEIYVSGGDVTAIMRRLDKDGDGRISYLEFLDAFLPPTRKEPATSPRTQRRTPEERVRSEPRRGESPREEEDRPLQIREDAAWRQGLERGIQTQAEEKLEICHDLGRESPEEEEEKARAPETAQEPARAFYQNPSPPLPQESKAQTEPIPPPPPQEAPAMNIVSKTAVTFQTPPRPVLSASIRREEPYSGSTVPSTSMKARMTQRIPEEPEEEDTSAVESELVRILRKQADIDSSLEERKIKVCIRHDFTPVDAFRMFDSAGDGVITLYEIRRTFDNLGVNYTRDGLYLLMKRYDQDLDGKLSIVEFERMIMPHQKEYADLIMSRAATAGRGETVFSDSTLTELKELFEQIMGAETAAEELRKDVMSAKSPLDVVSAFKLCDAIGKGYLSVVDVSWEI